MKTKTIPVRSSSGSSSRGKNIKENKFRLKEISMILFFFSILFIGISLLSYHHTDPSFFTLSRKTAQNWGGFFGASISAALVQLLGVHSFVFTFLLALLFRDLYVGETPKQITKKLFSRFGLLFFLCSVFGICFGTVSIGGQDVAIAGWLGTKFSNSLISIFNWFGALLVSLCGLAIFAGFSLNISFIDFLSFVSTKIYPFLKLHTQTVLTSLLASIEGRRTRKLMEKKLVSSKPTIVPAPKKMTEELEIPVAEKMKPDTTPKQKSSFISDLIEFVPKAEAKKPVKQSSSAPIGLAGNFNLPKLEYLNEVPVIKSELDKNRLIENSKILEMKLTDFGIEGQVVAVRPGPVITMYEFKPGPGVKISQIATLADDLSLALSAQSVRIVAPIPGKNVVGIEIPNDERETVFLREILSTEEFQGSNQGIPLAIGKDISGAPVTADLAKMPHLLIAGAPGAGKSVFINSLICSLLYKFTPNDMRLIMVDPKQLELNLYEDIPHLLLPVVDDPKKASNALRWAVNEMERRYKIMARSGIRNIAGFNQKLEKEGSSKMRELLCPELENGMPGEESLAQHFEHDEKGQPIIERIPFILVIIDEFADLMMVAPKDIETSVARLAQKARAAGIHLVIATQRPSVDVITGLIKANLPSRISFQVASKIDSRTILDGMGAEKLLGQGDMLFIPPGLAKLTRIHGAYVNEEEIEKICTHWKDQGKPVYREEILQEPDEVDADLADGAGDELYQQAISIVRDMGTASASMLQRRLKVGYNRAARMVEAMEMQGIVGPADGAKPREVLY